MKAYLITTATIFGLMTIVHAWRVVEESSSLAKDPWFAVITVAAAGLCIWALRLLRSTSRPVRAEPR
jgi:hypothetical protein